MSIEDKLITWRKQHLSWYEQHGVRDVNLTYIPNNSSHVPVSRDFRIFFICSKTIDFEQVKKQAISELSPLKLEEVDLVHVSI